MTFQEIDRLIASGHNDAYLVPRLLEHVRGQIGQSDLETLANIIVALWYLTDPGVSAAFGTTAPTLEALERCRQDATEIGRQRYPQHPLIEFWKSYIGWADLGDALDLEIAQRAWKAGYDDALVALIPHDLIARADPRVQRHTKPEDEAPTLRERYVREILSSGNMNGNPTHPYRE